MEDCEPLPLRPTGDQIEREVAAGSTSTEDAHSEQPAPTGTDGEGVVRVSRAGAKRGRDTDGADLLEAGATTRGRLVAASSTQSIADAASLTASDGIKSRRIAKNFEIRTCVPFTAAGKSNPVKEVWKSSSNFGDVFDVNGLASFAPLSTRNGGLGDVARVVSNGIHVITVLKEVPARAADIQCIDPTWASRFGLDAASLAAMAGHEASTQPSSTNADVPAAVFEPPSSVPVARVSKPRDKSDKPSQPRKRNRSQQPAKAMSLTQPRPSNKTAAEETRAAQEAVAADFDSHRGRHESNKAVICGLTYTHHSKCSRCGAEEAAKAVFIECCECSGGSLSSLGARPVFCAGCDHEVHNNVLLCHHQRHIVRAGATGHHVGRRLSSNEYFEPYDAERPEQQLFMDGPELPIVIHPGWLNRNKAIKPTAEQPDSECCDDCKLFNDFEVKSQTVVSLFSGQGSVWTLAPATVCCNHCHYSFTVPLADALDPSVYAVGTIKRPEQVFATRLLKQLALSDEQDSGVAVTAMHGQLKALYNSQRDPSCPEVPIPRRETLTCALNEWKKSEHHEQLLQGHRMWSCPACFTQTGEGSDPRTGPRLACLDANFKTARLLRHGNVEPYYCGGLHSEADFKKHAGSLSGSIKTDRKECANLHLDYEEAHGARGAAIDSPAIMTCVCNHNIVLGFLNLLKGDGEKYAYAHYMVTHLVADLGYERVSYDVMCRFWPWLEKQWETHAFKDDDCWCWRIHGDEPNKCPLDNLQHANAPAGSRCPCWMIAKVPQMHIKSHIIECQRQWNILYCTDLGWAHGEEVEQINRAISAQARLLKHHSNGAHSDRLSQLFMCLNVSRQERLHWTLAVQHLSLARSRVVKFKSALSAAIKSYQSAVVRLDPGMPAPSVTSDDCKMFAKRVQTPLPQQTVSVDGCEPETGLSGQQWAVAARYHQAMDDISNYKSVMNTYQQQQQWSSQRVARAALSGQSWLTVSNSQYTLAATRLKEAMQARQACLASGLLTLPQLQQFGAQAAADGTFLLLLKEMQTHVGKKYNILSKLGRIDSADNSSTRRIGTGLRPKQQAALTKQLNALTKPIAQLLSNCRAIQPSTSSAIQSLKLPDDAAKLNSINDLRLHVQGNHALSKALRDASLVPFQNEIGECWEKLQRAAEEINFVSPEIGNIIAFHASVVADIRAAFENLRDIVLPVPKATSLPSNLSQIYVHRNLHAPQADTSASAMKPLPACARFACDLVASVHPDHAQAARKGLMMILCRAARHRDQLITEAYKARADVDNYLASLRPQTVPQLPFTHRYADEAKSLVQAMRDWSAECVPIARSAAVSSGTSTLYAPAPSSSQANSAASSTPSKRGKCQCLLCENLITLYTSAARTSLDISSQLIAKAITEAAEHLRGSHTGATASAEPVAPESAAAAVVAANESTVEELVDIELAVSEPAIDAAVAAATTTAADDIYELNSDDDAMNVLSSDIRAFVDAVCRDDDPLDHEEEDSDDGEQDSEGGSVTEGTKEEGADETMAIADVDLERHPFLPMNDSEDFDDSPQLQSSELS